ncbi:hypothetical protein BDDG_12078 [Blastomyces dermatitidis ATCC 18188]|uniref:AMP-dependent synthetase/ligase domain-containing protein n=1 Tax=Ajellomyces dermatitidis (strain ATCC 18188 / CBS 674.68) TaxID=653446 RepID=A0A0J9EM00_AJEDA|nr:hypothetical protein BDDG_12078 [Blastomyces dermatitidis ATCC 18188]
MPRYSPFAPIPIPTSNLLTFLSPPESPLHTSTKPIWINSEDPSISLSTGAALPWTKRLAMGLERFQVASGGSRVKRGEVVLVLSPNQIFVAVAYLGIVGSGRVFSGMNPNYSVQEMVYQMKNTEAKIILVHPSLVDNALAAAKQADISPDRLFQFSDTVNSNKNDVRDWNNGLLATTQESHSYQWPELTGGEGAKTIATINYSSGTTGLPKGACVSHRNVIANVLQSTAIRGVLQKYFAERGPPQRWIGLLPLYHVTGSVGVLDPNCECKPLDDDGNEVADGEPATRETMLPNGWLRTGDIAIARGDWFWIVDRKKELIKVNALQVAPAEPEAALLEHDGIDDAAVVVTTKNFPGHTSSPRRMQSKRIHRLRRPKSKNGLSPVFPNIHG